MYTKSLTLETQQLIANAALGSPLEIYSPPTGPTILGGIVAFGLAALVGFLFFSEHDLNYSTVFIGLFIVLLGSVMGIIAIMTAKSNSRKHAVICTSGVAFYLYGGLGAFRWEDVLTTTRQSGSKGSLAYTVHCHDGRRIVFSGLIGLHMLAEAIDVQVARVQHA